MKGRGALSNHEGRFQSRVRERAEDDVETSRATEVRSERARTAITRNSSPDVPFDRSINAFRGCEHGCVYCYARPSHAYLDLSPGLDFETRITVRENLPERLREELAKPGYRPATITLGANTDPYQPLERSRRITREVLEVLADHRHPVTIITKGSLVLRDIDLLSDMAADNLASVMVSVTTLDNDLKRKLEPRTASGRQRLHVVEQLSEANIPAGVLAAPMIPAINDHELESILEAAAKAGARSAGYILLRLPHEVRDLFVEWLETHYPDRAEHVMSLIRQSRGGRDNDTKFGRRMRGTGQFADMLSQRFRVAAGKYGLDGERIRLDAGKFRVPGRAEQVEMFDR